jgi:hypothetical protein
MTGRRPPGRPRAPAAVAEGPKRRGRPPTGADPTITFRLPQPLLTRIEQWSVAMGVSRSEALRRLLSRGLKR